MTTITLPRADIPIDSTGTLMPSRDLYRWMRDVTERIGGTTGASTDDLSLAQFEDAGIAENLALLLAVSDMANQLPPLASQLLSVVVDNQRLSGEVEALRGQLMELHKLLDGGMQGTVQ